MRGVSLWKKIQREELKTGDHIYSSRGADKKVHHGIYVNDRNVIHFCRGACSDDTCPTCSDFYRVTSSCLDCFLYGGDLYRFEYGVTPAHFLAKFGRGCTLASTNEAEDVIDRASFFLDSGSPAHHRYINNGEDFAIYCKTGLLVVDMINFSRTWQIAYFLALTAAVFLSLQQLTVVSFTGLAARFLGLCCICIFASDIGARPNVIKLNEVNKLPEVDQILADGGSGFQLMESYIDKFSAVLTLALSLSLLSCILYEPHRGWSRILPLVWTQACVIFFYWAVLQRRLISNKIQKKQLRCGDHIYAWRNSYYAHHGIYIGDGIGREVIHLVRGGDPVLPSSSSTSHSHPSDSSISTGDDGNQPTLPYYCRVEYCSIDSFVDGGELNLYKYGVNLAFFMAKTQGGTCTHMKTDPLREVVYCARFLQNNNGFGAYNLFNNNCEDFAIYCKTAVLPPKEIPHIGRNGQIATHLAVFGATLISFLLMSPKRIFTIEWKGQIPLFLWPPEKKIVDDMKWHMESALAFLYSDFIGVVTTFYILYCMVRYLTDMAYVGIKYKVPVQRISSYSRLADWFQSNFCQFILN